MNTTEIQRIKQRYNIVGNSDGLNRALDVALQVAPTDLSVLIIGESGVGKEKIPRVIHDNSPRKREKYFAINCGSIPEGTIDSELFGHEKGSFTGAIGESEGYFGTANKGSANIISVKSISNIAHRINAKIKIKIKSPVSIGIGMPHKSAEPVATMICGAVKLSPPTSMVCHRKQRIGSLPEPL